MWDFHLAHNNRLPEEGTYSSTWDLNHSGGMVRFTVKKKVLTLLEAIEGQSMYKNLCSHALVLNQIFSAWKCKFHYTFIFL